MSEVSPPPPELARGVLQLARALLVAVRHWSLYPPEHPAVGISVTKLADAIRQASLGTMFSIGITPDTLLVDGAPADRTQRGIAEAAAMLHERDLLTMTFVGDVPPHELRAFLRMLTLDPAERRRRGGAARIWQADGGHPSIALEQIDYEDILAREETEGTESAKRDDLWRSIVMSIAGAETPTFDQRTLERLLAIAGSPTDIADLATAVMAPKCTADDGSPMILSQAATVLATFRHLTNTASVMSPERVPEVIGNIATAVADIDPHVVLEVMQSEENAVAGMSVAEGLASAFDDHKAAQLLATSLALDGQASDRLATIFNTIAPDDDRKRRVLTLTRSMLSETDFGQAEQFEALWTSMEELLISYNEKPFAAEAYRAALDGVSERAERLAAGEMPPELSEWMESLGQANVRALSVRLLIDLLTIEHDETRACEIALDMEALAEDLLMSGAYDDVTTVSEALADRAKTPGAMAADACRQGLDRLGESTAMRDTATLLGEVDEDGWKVIAALMAIIGPASVEALKPLMASEDETLALKRAADLIVAVRPPVARLASLTADERWFVQRNAARVLGRLGVPDAVPLLLALARQTELPVVRAAVAALIAIPDQSAGRALSTVLRGSTGATRRAVIETLAAGRDPRVISMLIRIIDESRLLGKEHDLVLDTVAALGSFGVDQAIQTLVSTIKRRAFWRRKKLRALKQTGVDALARIGTEKATAALEDAARTGDRMLRKIIAGRRG